MVDKGGLQKGTENAVKEDADKSFGGFSRFVKLEWDHLLKKVFRI
jgi:hypothetical protein